jgi:hypothetical protein
MAKKSGPHTEPDSPTMSKASKPAAVQVQQKTFFSDVRTILQQARHQAYSAANFLMVEAYWKIGHRIVQEEQNGKDRADYGAQLIRHLARDLTDEFGRGLSVANLWNFRQFYLTFASTEKLYALRRELTWTHWRLVMRVQDPSARSYYVTETADHGWTTRQLERAIATSVFDRLLRAPEPHDDPQTNPLSPATFIKDPYVLEFLGLPANAEHAQRCRICVDQTFARFFDGTGQGVFFRRAPSAHQYRNEPLLR